MMNESVVRVHPTVNKVLTMQGSYRKLFHGATPDLSDLHHIVKQR